MNKLQFIEHVSELTSEVDVILSDIWGVVHDGMKGFSEASEALLKFRQQGGTVILITNAPLPAESVKRQLLKMGVSEESFDAIVSSGDLARKHLEADLSSGVFHIGGRRDNPIFRGLNVKFAPIESADYVLCTGLFNDEIETAEDYRQSMIKARERELTLVCANPDIVVERGDRLIYCAGAIAELYRELGGKVIFYGKPHVPIYDRALEIAKLKRGKSTPKDRILAIGDSVRTDLTGANTMGFRCLFVTRGIHAADFHGIREIDEFAIKRLFGDTRPPLALMFDLKH